MRTVIGIAGVKTSGKSTVTKIIQEVLPGTTESALAGKLKDVCASVFGLTRDQFDLQELKEIPFENPKILSDSIVSQILLHFDAVDVDNYQIIMDKYKSVIDMELDTPRKIAQIVGTEVLRANGDEDIHCKNMTLNPNPELPTIISDLRFPNEFEYFNNNPEIKFVPLYLNRQEAEKHVTSESHPSETSVFLFNKKCIEIDNNGTLEQTREQVLKALKETGVL
jgi:hypothetical protein